MAIISRETAGEYLYTKFSEPIDGVRPVKIYKKQAIPPPAKADLAVLATGIATVRFQLSPNIDIPLGLFRGVSYMGGALLMMILQLKESPSQNAKSCI